MADIEFRDPPPSKGGRPRSGRDDAAIAGALRSRPGEWAYIGQVNSKTHASAIKSGRLVAFRPAGSFDATQRKNADVAGWDLYARYVGEPS